MRVVGVTSPDWEREFADYVAARSRLLCTTAYLLCGDWQRAEDHAQTALTSGDGSLAAGPAGDTPAATPATPAGTPALTPLGPRRPARPARRCRG